MSKKNIISYQAFGFVVHSEIALPELMVYKKEKNPDIYVKWEEPCEEVNLMDRPYEHVVDGDFVHFHIPTVGCFSVYKGEEIVISPLLNVEEGLIRLYVLGTCMGIILMKRGLLPLHGSAVVIDNKVYAFVGDSGAGKSTVASTFLQKGYELASDDVIAVSLSGGIPMVTPSYPQQKMWKDSLGNLGMDEKQYSPLYDREEKYSIPVEQYCEKVLPLAGIFELTTTMDNHIILTEVTTLERFEILLKHTYRNFLIDSLGKIIEHFQDSTYIASYAKMYKLQRPQSIFSAQEMVELIIKTVKEGEIK